MATGQVKAAIADDGTIVVRDPLSKIVLQDYQLNLTGVVASDTKGFTTVGMAPEISDDSNAVVFYGNYNGTGTNITPGLQSGAGIFVSITTDTGRVIKRIAGVAGNGVLDPGEKFTDNNNNGVFDSGVDTDTGLIGGFAPDEKLGVTFNKTPDGGYGNVAYLGTDSAGKEALFSSQFNLSSSSSEPIITTKLVAKVGQPAGEVSSQLTGNIQDLNIYDPINDKGQIAFWVKTDAAQEAVVRANPILKPVLLVPGIGATFPKGNFKDWIMNRGVQPDTLRADPLGLLWDDLVETLKRAGYVEGVNLFVATTDWRLNPGPVDGVFDGKIHRSVEELMDNKYEYSVDQLAFWLKKAVEGWRSQFKGIPDANIPELTDVDIIAHSAGGLTTRAYIQDEDAYGKKFTTIAGKDINLPKVDNFITLGVPYRGGTTAWNLLHNDFDGAPFTTFLGQILRVAYKKVKDNNEVIKLSGSTSISEGAINKSLLEGLSLNGFIEKYVPSLKSLLATYKFVDVIADNPSQDLKRAEYLGLDEANKFLVDLNYGYDSEQNQEFVDPTLFANQVNKLTVVYSTGKPARDAVVQRNTPDYEDVIVYPGGIAKAEKHSILPFQNELLAPVAPKPGEIWYEEKEGFIDDADGTVPLLSSKAMFEQYPRANVKLHSFPGVGHGEFPFKKDVQKLILEKLNVGLKEESISTNLHKDLPNLNWGYVFSSILPSTILFDPIEGFLVDGQGRRLGYTQATGAITEIPNSQWLGDKDGFGFIEGLVEGPFELQLIGTGQNYYVSALLETSQGPAAIEENGFLAAGEQKNVNIPVNNYPILDLNGTADGIDSTANLAPSQQTITLNNSLKLTDSESTNLTGATITLKNPLDGTSESLSATATGNITVAYNAATKTLTLNGTDTIANYEQVLKSVKYTNTKANPNLTPRQIEFVVNDGASFNNLSPTATTTVIFSLNRSGTTGNDTLIGADGNDTLKGLEGNDRLEGKAGNDSLDGGTGNDNMIGDAGNDVYVVDSTSDVVSETPTTAGEIDTVQSSVTHTLGANLENLALTGTAAINANGNALANKITGNAANNVLNGSTGADSLYSGFFYTEVDGIAGYSAGDTLLTNGNDTYIVDNAGDKVKESGTTATTEVDTVKSSVTFTLTNPTVADPDIALSRVENLELTGTGVINATGNALNNKITGNIAANTLDGAAGNDTLTGGQSSDRFLYNTNTAFTSSAVGIDTITDFAVGSDKILLDKTTFTALQSVAGNGFSVVSDFAIVSADSLAGASSGLIVYSSASDNLFYNPDGTTAGLASGGQFATLSGIASLNASDFEIQA
jgi:Ca2+-binding RTX toxin-like protein